METKKRLVFLCRGYGVVNRGVEAHVKELSLRLSERFYVEIFSGSDADSLQKVLKGKFDLVIPTNGRIQALKMSMGRIIGGYKVLIVAHAGIGKDEIWNLLTMPDVYVALTDYELSWAKKNAVKSKLIKIPNGIDLKEFNPKGDKVDLGLDKPVVLSVGALEWYKHHDLAIQAVSKLDASLLIVGEGSLKNYLEKMGNELLGKKRFKVMKAEYSRMPSIYRSANLFTLPSWDREAFGIVYLEAMASGLPVVAPDDLSRKEIIGEAGIFTDVFDIGKYSDSIYKSLNNKWSDLPIKQSEKFSWDKIADKYAELILEICK